MNEILTLAPDEFVPPQDAVLENQGIPADKPLSPEIDTLFRAALALLNEVAAPAGILREVSQPDFERIYHGEGRNEASTPVGDIFPKAADLALFAVTLGKRISQAIDERFKSNDLALGAMLDSAASAGADQLGEALERRYVNLLIQTGRATSDTGVLRYSPGYCGWHISGQKKLFEYLHPEQIGISLRDSFLMEPLKSISGVLIAGPQYLHIIRKPYPACGECKNESCRRRVPTMLDR
jgi:hypothetical protein